MSTIDLTTVAPDTAVTVTLADGDTVTGTFVKVTPKTVKVNVDGKIRTFHLDLVRVDVYGDDTDVLTTAEFAAIFDTNAKALRVVLRKLGLGVGKGNRYGLPRSLVTTHGDAIRSGLAG
jgi:hypothetical protein